MNQFGDTGYAQQDFDSDVRINFSGDRNRLSYHMTRRIALCLLQYAVLHIALVVWTSIAIHRHYLQSEPDQDDEIAWMLQFLHMLAALFEMPFVI